MPLNRGLYREVLTKCYRALEFAGFARYRPQNVDWPLNDGFHAWVGLNRAPEAESVEINPFVGVHAVEIERLWTRLDNRDYLRSSATYAVHMGEIAPDNRVFVFTLDTDIEAEANRLAHLYATVGLAYAQSIATYEDLLPLLKGRVDMLGAYPERIACCLYLMGRRQGATEFVRQFLDQEPEYFERFAENFLAELK